MQLDMVLLRLIFWSLILASVRTSIADVAVASSAEVLIEQSVPLPRPKEQEKAELAVSCERYGCSRTAADAGKSELKRHYPVCGVDGLTYRSACFAVCQGVEVVKDDGPCPGDEEDDSDENDTGEWTMSQDSPIAVKTLERFSAEGFRLVRDVGRPMERMGGQVLRRGRTSLGEDPPHSGNHHNNENNHNNDNNDKGDIKPDDEYYYQSIRMTSDGYEYRTALNRRSSTRGADYSEGWSHYIPPGLDEHHGKRRELLIVGKDQRSRVKNTTAFPFSAIVSMNYADCQNCCTGTVVSRTSILTAAHCVFDVTSNLWDSHTFIVPGRNGGGASAAESEPFGRWFVDYATIYRVFRNRNNDPDFDIAVVKYSPNIFGLELGDVVGYVGLDRLPRLPVDSNDNVGGARKLLLQSSITGYPEDYPLQMWTSGPCNVSDGSNASNMVSFQNSDLYSYIIQYNCDTNLGMSGSGLLGPDYRIRAVHTFGLNNVNAGVAFVDPGPHYQNIVKWSGHTPNSENSDSRTRQGQNPLIRKSTIMNKTPNVASNP